MRATGAFRVQSALPWCASPEFRSRCRPCFACCAVDAGEGWMPSEPRFQMLLALQPAEVRNVALFLIFRLRAGAACAAGLRQTPFSPAYSSRPRREEQERERFSRFKFR